MNAMLQIASVADWRTSVSSQQQELFDAFLRHDSCRKCQRRLHTDKRQQYRTRVAGLCFGCLAEWERWPGWSVDKFIDEETTDGDRIQT